jgi:hypothetical protein
MFGYFVEVPQQSPRLTARLRNAAGSAVAAAARNNVVFAFHSPICSQLGLGKAPLRCGVC